MISENGHETIEQVVQTTSVDYLTDLLMQIKELSTYFKKISVINQAYYKNQNDEYRLLHQRIQTKLTNMITNFLSIINKENEFSEFFTLQNFDEIVNSVEDIFEKISENVDIIKGIKKENENEDIKNELKSLQQSKLNKKANLEHEKVKKDYFDIDNSYYPFIPKITEKVNMIEPLDEKINDARKLRNENKNKFSLKFEDCKNKEIQQPLFSNPYSKEIAQFTQKYVNQIREDSETYNSKNDIVFKEINEQNQIDNENQDKYIVYIQNFKPSNMTPLFFIQTEDELNNLIEKLKKQKEIAIDLEHHCQESYLGITCLLQMSTRDEDFIVDTLKLRNELHKLNIVFTDPKIIKVFHGADYDIEWLQKDFGLYVINMFDTGQASRILRYPSFALKYLLKRICQFDADKKYQLADWRIRPLPQEMINYARSDTHYLLYIYDVLRKELIEKSMTGESENGMFNCLIETIRHSNEICLKSYQKPKVKSMEYYNFIAIHSGKKHRELGIIKEIFMFRDYIARKLDISTDKVLSKTKIIKLSKIKKFDFDNVIQVLEGFSPLIKFIPEFIEVINKKIERIENKEKNKVNINELKEREYCSKIKEMLKRDEEKTSNKIKKETNTNFDFEKNKKSLDEIENSINVGNISSINILKSKFLPEISQKKQTKNEVEDIKNSFNNFNLISYLKNKHNITKITIKKRETVNKKEKEELKRKRDDENSEESKKREEEKIIQKFNKFNDITDNKKIIDKLNKEQNISSEEESEDDSIVIENNEKKVDPSLKLKEKFMENFLKNTKNIKSYDNRKHYGSKKKRK